MLQTLKIMPAENFYILCAFLTVLACAYTLSIVSVRLQGPRAPLVGFKSVFEPRLVANFRFFKNSSAIINEGYLKV